MTGDCHAGIRGSRGLQRPRPPDSHGSGSAGHVGKLSFSDTSHQGILYWNAIYTQLALDALPGRSADDELAGLMPTIFERVA